MVENEPNRICEIHIDGICFRMLSAAKITQCILNGRKLVESHMRTTYIDGISFQMQSAAKITYSIYVCSSHMRFGRFSTI